MLAAATIEEGVLGLEGIHVWDSSVSLNNLSTLPRFRLDRISGLHSLPEADDVREPLRGRIGERMYPSLARGKTVTYEGRVQAWSFPELREAVAVLRSAFSDRSNILEMEVMPNATRGGQAFSYFARTLACDIDDVQDRGPRAVPSPYQRRFTLSLRQADPRYYADIDSEGPFTSGSTHAITNVGTAPAEPVITIDGPLTQIPLIERTTVDPRGLNLVTPFDPDTVGGAESIVFDFGARTIIIPELDEDVTDRVNFVKDWWDDGVAGLLPGAQNIKVTGGAWSISWRPAVW